jgi:hypothetical protein
MRPQVFGMFKPRLRPFAALQHHWDVALLWSHASQAKPPSRPRRRRAIQDRMYPLGQGSDAPWWALANKPKLTAWALPAHRRLAEGEKSCMLTGRSHIPMLDLSKIERPANLPQWERPPVDEVAISVQFNDMPGLKIVHYGQLADRFRQVGLTQYEDKGALPASFEVFGKRVAAPVSFQFQAVDEPLPRV